MSVKNSKGLDDIPIKLLKVLTVAQAHFINLSIKLGQFPEVLNIGKIVPVYKKGELSVEQVVASSVYDYMESKYHS